MRAADNKEKIYLIALWVMVACYIGIYFTASVIRFFAFDFDDMDLAVYDQIIWNILHGQWYSSILGVYFLGHHAHFLAFPLAVIYAFIPHPLTLLFIQTLVLGVSAYPLYLLAGRCLDTRCALFASALYLLYPGVGRTNVYEFHFTPFATLSLMSACYFFFEEKYRAFSLSMVVTLLCQENMSLVVIAFGFYALLLRRPPKWWLPFMVMAAFYFIFCIKFLFPMLNPNHIQFISIYDHFGRNYSEILKTLVIHPFYTLSYMFALDRVAWLFNLFSPLLFISLMAPMHLLPALPLFLQHLLSNRPQEINLRFHYTAELIPFIFVSFVFGLQKLIKYVFIRQRLLFAMIIMGEIAILGAMDFEKHLPFGNNILGNDGVAIKQRMLRMVSPNSDLVATFAFMPQVSHRKNLYSFHHIYGGMYTLSDLLYEMPDNVDEALIDFNDRLTFNSFYDPQRYLNIQAMIERYHLVPLAACDNTVFFKKNGTPMIELYRGLNGAPPDLIGKPPLFAYNGIELKKIQTLLKGNALEMVMVWTAKAKPSRDINFYIEFLDDKGKFVRRTWEAVCYRILPTQAWKAGQWVMDHKYLAIPSQLRNSKLKIKVGFYDQVTRRILGRCLYLVNS